MLSCDQWPSENNTSIVVVDTVIVVLVIFCMLIVQTYRWEEWLWSKKVLSPSNYKAAPLSVSVLY